MAELDLDVTVHAFEVQRARIAYAPSYYAEWGRETGIPEFAQSDEWINAILLDLAEHSHNSLVGMGYGGGGAAIDFSTLPQEVGSVGVVVAVGVAELIEAEGTLPNNQVGRVDVAVVVEVCGEDRAVNHRQSHSESSSTVTPMEALTKPR